MTGEREILLRSSGPGLFFKDAAGLTCGGWDVDIDADLGGSSVPQRRHAGVGAEVGELEVDDVEVGGSQRHVGVGVSDDHPLRALQRSAVLQPTELQLLRGRGFHLAADLHLPADLDVVVVVVRVRRDPEPTFTKACGRQNQIEVRKNEKYRTAAERLRGQSASTNIYYPDFFTFWLQKSNQFLFESDRRFVPDVKGFSPGVTRSDPSIWTEQQQLVGPC